MHFHMLVLNFASILFLRAIACTHFVEPVLKDQTVCLSRQVVFDDRLNYI